MGLFEKIFGRPRANYGGYWQTLTGYTPVFKSFGGDLYESELVRSAIESRARHISKLRAEIQGTAKPSLQSRLRLAPNEFQTWSQFLARTSTILDMQNTAMIVPVTGDLGEVTGIYTVLPSMTELVNADGVPYIRYTFSSGQKAAIPLSDVGILTKYQYKSDFFGSDNKALTDTLNLISIQRQGIEEATKNSNTFRFWARIANFSTDKDLAAERKRFTETNFQGDGGGGVLLFPNNYTDIHQASQQSYTVDAEQMQLIQTNVGNYFGTNLDILQNKATGDAWSAFYEGAIEPFAIQFSEVVTRMLFSRREREQGTFLQLTANRLQYMSNADKLSVSAQMADRGIMTINEIRDMWSLAPIEGGDRTIMRGEYKSGDGREDQSQAE